MARPSESPLAQEAAASEHELDLAMAQLEGPIRMMRSLREKISLLERRREELETVVVRERASFRDQLNRAKKAISETEGSLTGSKEEAARAAKASNEAREQLQHSATRLEAATAEIARLRQELSAANSRMNQTVTSFRARYAQDTGRLQQTLELAKGRHAVELASFKQACTELRTRAMSAEAAFKQLQAREGNLKSEATATLNRLKQREQQIRKMVLSSHLWASELERLRKENESLSAKASLIEALSKERDHWRTLAHKEREQRRQELLLRATTEQELRARVAELEDRGRGLEGRSRELEEQIRAKAEEEGRARSERGRAQAEFLQACAQLERAREDGVQAKSRLSRIQAELESSREQVQTLRLEGPIHQLLIAKERELGRLLEASRGLLPGDPGRARADQVIEVLEKQVEVLKRAVSESGVAEATKKAVTPPPFRRPPVTSAPSAE